ncbi:MAG: DUF4301 family protein [Balneolaceae bacterium]|nr:MAG: DUF4301 family protein [Balneolaceae bacterium]
MKPADIETQLDRFRKGFPDLEIDRPATIGDGIVRIPDEEEMRLTDRFHQAQKEGRVMKFVPASGAASRMFKSLQAMLNGNGEITKEHLESGSEDAEFTRTFLDNLKTFAFYEDLVDALKGHGTHPDELLKKEDYRALLSFVLEDKGLGLASLPKALIPFHRYEDHRRTPLEEHLVEAIAYTQPENGHVRIHYTISPEHKEAFDRRLDAVRPRYETGGIRLHVETSFQKPETDTIAADPDNQPFLDDDGNPVFRPGGHGALLVNLEELKGDLVFIKNIDNVVPDRLKDVTYRYKKLIGGYLLTLQDKIFFYLKELERQGAESQLIDEIIAFVREELHVKLPDDLPSLPDDDTDEAQADAQRSELVRWLFDRLNRPIRVCGMVINEGEPGGGPFVVRHGDGSTSLQIVESAQVNMENNAQKQIFESSTHFNPVDLVCSLRDYQGRPFELEDYRDPETGFISMKSFQGRDLKALELPGLWNGSMARWNTVFVEVPADTFHPVKTVNDLLREEHRN